MMTAFSALWDNGPPNQRSCILSKAQTSSETVTHNFTSIKH